MFELRTDGRRRPFLQLARNKKMRTWLVAMALAMAVHSLPCIKWHETKDCDPQGIRDPSKDSSCSTTISSKRSGYCECGTVQDRSPAIRAHEVGCDHHEFTCENVCEEDSNANLEGKKFAMILL